MLVLTRKIGQQLVLPEHGITIEVVDVGKTRVRLGISAPADVPVHRREVWDRDHGTDKGPSASSNATPDRLAADEPKGPTAPAPSFAELGQCLAAWITKRTGGRILQLSVERLDGRIVIRGAARSHYVRQLARAAVDEVLNVCDRLSQGAVEYNIDVAQVYWRSAGRTRGLTRLRGAEQ